jgi:hypothetical protein
MIESISTTKCHIFNKHELLWEKNRKMLELTVYEGNSSCAQTVSLFALLVNQDFLKTRCPTQVLKPPKLQYNMVTT